MNIGLLMICDEEDILERTLALNEYLFDAFYVLDGSESYEHSKEICTRHPLCAGYWRDAELPSEYPDHPVDGYRQFIYEQAVAEHGYDHWFLLLHGDEVWTCSRDDLGANTLGYIFPLPFYFPRTGEPWDYDRHPLDQLHWRLGPGWPELRAFRGAEHIHYDRTQHFDVTPKGLAAIATCDRPILHYLYRSPEVQRRRAQRHAESGFHPGNYQHITEGNGVYWTDEMIASAREDPRFRELAG